MTHEVTEPITAEQCLEVSLKNGRTFRMSMAYDAAPIAAGYVLKLATLDHYYDGLTFHRIVPNFIIQGGSPGANEYAGQKNYMRDEIQRTNDRGTVGLSTRGRNTGDAQFYINLVDNPRLDILRQLLAQDPANTFVRYGLAMEHVKSGDLAGAVRI